MSRERVAECGAVPLSTVGWSAANAGSLSLFHVDTASDHSVRRLPRVSVVAERRYLTP